MFIRKMGIVGAGILFLFATTAFCQQLNYGKYFGTIQMAGRSEVIAVSLDAFIVQINDPTVYPELNVIVRVNLGGYSSSEYVGYNFYDPTFDFERGILQLNDAKNELTATLKVTNTDSQTILEGPVSYRPTNSKGTMRVVMNLDDSISQHQPKNSAAYLSVLAGEYLGACGGHATDLQIETARVLGDATPGNALSGYSITGRLGFTGGPLCVGTDTGYCNSYPFSKGIYNLYGNHLTLQGPLATLDCDRSVDNLSCTLKGHGQPQTCKLGKKPASVTGPIQIPAGIFINVSPDQKKPLPNPLPPGNDELIAALNGEFYGFLHYENRDLYQLMQMSIVASTSTENPHVQNQVMVEPTVSLRLGSSWESTPVYTTLFPQRVFYLNQGFAFQANDNENMAVITSWRAGWVNGVWYSRSYGRVGTFELIKGSTPQAPSKMVVFPDFVGSFIGPSDAPAALKNLWSIEIEAPNQTAAPKQEAAQLLGRYQLNNQISSVQLFDAATLDLNTGALGFLAKKEAGDRLITGQVISDRQIKLLWPVGPALGAPMGNYQAYTYGKMAH